MPDKKLLPIVPRLPLVKALPHHGSVITIINSIIPGVTDGLAVTKEGVDDDEIVAVAVSVDTIDGSTVGRLDKVMFGEPVRFEIVVVLALGRALVPFVDVDSAVADAVEVEDAVEGGDTDKVCDILALFDSNKLSLTTADTE